MTIPAPKSRVSFSADGKTISGEVKQPYLQIADENGKLWYRKADSVSIVDGQEIPVGSDASPAAEATPTVASVDVNVRFSYARQLVAMVVAGRAPSCIISGEGGLGKTYTVRQVLEAANLIEDEDYIFVKGYSSAKGLFNTLRDHSDRIVVFDDCDKVLMDQTAKNLLKGALDSYERRTINWNTDSAADAEDGGKFEFTGKVIFISNMGADKIDQAIVSRSMFVDLSMSTSEKISRLRALVTEVRQEVSLEVRGECMDMIEHLAPGIKDLNIRTLLKCITIAAGAGANWKQLAEYMLLS